MRVRDSHAYRKMDVTREHFSHLLELREILLSVQTGFNLVNAAVVCAILVSTSHLEPSSVMTEPRYLKLVDSLKLLSIYFDLLVDAAGVICHERGLLCNDLHAARLCRDAQLILSVLLPPLLSHRFISKTEIGDCSASSL